MDNTVKCDYENEVIEAEVIEAIKSHFTSIPKKETIEDFIQYAKENSEKFVHYCEIVLDKFGNVYQVRPSHTETLIYLDMKKHNLTREEYLKNIPMYLAIDEYIISKEGYISVWYPFIKIPKSGINSRQRRSLDMLRRNGLIKQNYEVKLCDEYQLHLWRVENGLS